MAKFKTLELAIDFYQQTTELEITGNLKDQFLRAAAREFGDKGFTELALISARMNQI